MAIPARLTQKELQGLPRAPLSVFAVRCAWRVQPLYTGAYAAQLNDALAIATERLQLGQSGKSEPLPEFTQDDQINYAVATAIRAAVGTLRPDGASDHTATAATSARAAVELATQRLVQLGSLPPAAVIESTLMVDFALMRDFAHLIKLDWSSDTSPFDPTENGPLGLYWPESQPPCFA